MHMILLLSGWESPVERQCCRKGFLRACDQSADSLLLRVPFHSPMNLVQTTRLRILFLELVDHGNKLDELFLLALWFSLARPDRAGSHDRT